MARPNKQGLDYFSFDVDFFEDEKIEAISGEFGIKGEIATIKLLCAVYRNGYFILWSDMLKMKLLKHLPGISSELLDAILNRLVVWDFFDKSLFNSVGVLTSKGIQRRFFEATKRRQISENLPYILINADNNEVNAYNNLSRGELLHTKTTQSKVKKSKVKKKELSNDSSKKATDVATRKDSFLSMLKSFSSRYPESMLTDFFNYWTELNPSGNKMRFEMQRTWETSKRLATWAKNDLNFSKTKQELPQMPSIFDSKPQNGDRNDKGQVWSEERNRWLN